MESGLAMRRKHDFFFYTCMWVVAIIVLMVLLLQNLGDARIVNYSGIVRGATQKLVKEELNGQPDEELLARLDGIIDNLQTGLGEYGLRRNGDKAYQQQLVELKAVWGLVKKEIYRMRAGTGSGEELYELSQRHFSEADKLVLLAEQHSDRKLVRFIIGYSVLLVLSVAVFMLFNRRRRKELEKSMYTDSLTGLYNRAGFEAEAVQLLRQHGGQGYCLVEFDVDDFKFLNSSYGYELGDRLLCALGDRLRREFHTDQLCARISADDFVVLIKQEEQAAEHVRGLLSSTLRQEEFLVVSEFVTFTLGGYEIPEAGEQIQSIMDKANMAHKNAKTLGKAMTVWYDKTLLEKLNWENRMKNRMHRALADEEFQMYLQPKYRLSGLEVQSAEALVRWELPGQGTVYPDDFIPLFERNGCIAELDFYMLDKACGFLRDEASALSGEFSISVNFSRVTIYQQNFAARLLETVERYQVPHRRIEIEITESAFNEVSDVMVSKLEQLGQEGFIISMDDFGSGYSSLNSLDKLPIQVLKLDREFLREYGQADRVKNVIACVIELAHGLKMEVVCEGIEQQEHLRFLQEAGCDYGQGYYFSRPVPSQEFLRAKV